MNTQISFKEMAERGKEILASQGPITYEKAKEQIDRLRKGSYLRSMQNLRITIQGGPISINQEFTEEFIKEVKDKPELIGKIINNMIENIGFPPKVYDTNVNESTQGDYSVVPCC